MWHDRPVMWLFVVCAVVAVALTVALATGRLDGGVSAGLSAPTSSLSHEGLPDGPLDGQDVAGLRFDIGVRGYRMAQVDAVLDRLRDELDRARAEIGQLQDAADDRRAVQELASPVSAVVGPADETGEQLGEPLGQAEEPGDFAAPRSGPTSGPTGSDASLPRAAGGAGAGE